MSSNCEEELAACRWALGQIDYLFGPPNQWELSQYGLDGDLDAVVERVKAYVEQVRQAARDETTRAEARGRAGGLT